MITADLPERARFAEYAKLQMQNRRFLDREEERRLLEDALTRFGLGLDEATGLLRHAAEDGAVALEGELGVSARQLLKTMADRRGRVARADFDRAVAFFRARAGGGVTEAEAKRRMKRLMEEAELQPKPSGRLLRSRRWYRVIEA
jgi:hypothetical protein